VPLPASLAAKQRLDNRTLDCTVQREKSIPITELRQRVAQVIEDVQASDEPTIVMQRSRPAAYVVNPVRFERDQAELSSLRRALFLHEVHEAEAEYVAGEAKQFDDVEALLDELGS
jgi:prevent-host-death family protein